MKLLIATFNHGKLEDYKLITQGLPLEVVSLYDMGIGAEYVEEFGTFEENAKAKAKHYYDLAKIPTLADDSGIEIPFYNMEPGVHTKSWGGFGRDGHEYRKFILEKIKAIPHGERKAQLKAVLAYHDGTNTYVEEGVIHGTLTDQVYPNSQTQDYPWDPVFIVDGLNKYYEEISPEENLQYNHRALAFNKLKPRILT